MLVVIKVGQWKDGGGRAGGRVGRGLAPFKGV